MVKVYTKIYYFARTKFCKAKFEAWMYGSMDAWKQQNGS